MEDNNELLAEKIYKIENARFKLKQEKEWRKVNVEVWKLTDNIRLEKSEDGMCWYLWKYNSLKCDYGFFKVIPKLHCSKKTIEKMLDAQSWVWIEDE